MLSNSFVNFYNNWSAKYDSIDGEDLSHLFDKYVTLFIIYNSLYTLIPETLIAQGIHVRPNMNDNEMSTKLVTKFIGASDLLSRLNELGNNHDIVQLIGLIHNEEFYINLYYGQRQRNEDLKILVKLKSTNDSQKAVGVLEVIYNVRCNLMHGHKNFVEPQRQLLSPLIRILKSLNGILFERLSI
ncbi:hypothetical protein ACTJKN_21015 [Pedobacter sp. 22163]|uniref:hypothetical protein n=1 Tax=Pedobacter sp. 22163 TaxID=3453883 RepID=UPI003F853948